MVRAVPTEGGRVEQHVLAVLQVVDVLRHHQSRSEAELRASIDVLSAVAHEMQIGIQSALEAFANALIAYLDRPSQTGS